MKKQLITLTLIFFLALNSVHAEETTSMDLNEFKTAIQQGNKISDLLQQGTTQVTEVKDTFQTIVVTAVTFLEKLVDLLLINPVTVIGLILEIFAVTMLIEMFAGGWGFKHWMQVIGALIGIISYPFILDWLAIPVLKAVGL